MYSRYTYYTASCNAKLEETVRSNVSGKQAAHLKNY